MTQAPSQDANTAAETVAEAVKNAQTAVAAEKAAQQAERDAREERREAARQKNAQEKKDSLARVFTIATAIEKGLTELKDMPDSKFSFGVKKKKGGALYEIKTNVK